ncbi:MAG: hypothetical protein RLY20_3113 [Verrucomicrobiota bacterium]|jgi:iron complex outermembrane receptor protein
MHYKLAPALCLTLAAMTATAQNIITNEPSALPPVTVIGEKPALQQPETIAAGVVAGDLFERGDFDNTRGLTAIAPNTSLFDGNNQRTPRFSLRGFRENNFLLGEPTVALYVDDVPFVDLASRGLPLYNVEQAEFYRGPQAALFGANGIGGVMNIRTEQPGNDWHGHANVGFGSYDEQSYQLGISGPVAKDQLALGISGLFSTQDGFVRNLTTGSRADDRETLSGRAVLRWTPTEKIDISLTLTGDRYRDDFIPTYYPTTLFPPGTTDESMFRVRRNIDGYNNTDAFGQALRVGYDAGEVRLVSVTTHRDWQQDLLQDFDFTSLQLRNGFSRPKVETWSEEIRVQSPNAGEKVKWLAGLFFADTRAKTDSGSDEFTPITLAPNFVSGPPTTFRTLATSDGQTYAGFGQATWSVNDQLDLVGGLRLNHDVRSINRSKTVSSPTSTFFDFPAGAFTNSFGAYDTDMSFTHLVPKAGAAWHFNSNVLGYASFSGGYQSGGFNASNDDPAQSKFDPARSWNYEAGLKSDWAEHRLSANLAFFYTDTQDYQVYRLNGADPSQSYVENADRATTWGAELEVTARPAAGWEFTGGLGYTHAEYNRYFDSVNGVSLDGKRISFVPEFTANIAGQYRLPCGLYARVEVQALGDYYLTEDNTAKQSAFALLNARLGYDTKIWSIYVFGRNVLDQHYAANALDLRYALQPDQLVLQPGNPATIGVAITARF